MRFLIAVAIDPSSIVIGSSACVRAGGRTIRVSEIMIVLYNLLMSIFSFVIGEKNEFYATLRFIISNLL
jgi:hypothetical protein